jgi:hypothetical protein
LRKYPNALCWNLENSDFKSVFQPTITQSSHLAITEEPFLFGSLIDSFVEHHRTATGALFELMFSQEEELDERGEEGIYLFTSVAISQTPSRIAIKRARLGEGSQFPYR